jgi:preprotein translocase subunit SecB
MNHLEVFIKDLVSHKIQLKTVQLVKLEVINNFNVSSKETTNKVDMVFSNGANEIDSNKTEATLGLKVFFKNIDPPPFFINIVYSGICETNENVSMADLKMFAELQSIPLLWPYIRQTLSDVMAKMSINPIILPTMDVVQTLVRITRQRSEDKTNEFE